MAFDVERGGRAVDAEPMILDLNGKRITVGRRLLAMIIRACDTYERDKKVPANGLPNGLNPDTLHAVMMTLSRMVARVDALAMDALINGGVIAFREMSPQEVEEFRVPAGLARPTPADVKAGEVPPPRGA